MNEDTYCAECGEPCDGSYHNALNEPLCYNCADELGYADAEGGGGK